MAGSRELRDERMLLPLLDVFHEEHGIALLIEGGCSGADLLSALWALWRRVRVVNAGAGWWRDRRASAWAEHNQAILDRYSPDVIVAVAGDKRSEDMVRRARKAKVRVWTGPSRPITSSRPDARPGSRG